jgi:hypothetical protein
MTVSDVHDSPRGFAGRSLAITGPGEILAKREQEEKANWVSNRVPGIYVNSPIARLSSQL